MKNNRTTTEFSTHLSRSRMRRYLHGQLTTKESQQVEVHLANCAHCSATLVNYIETEESDQYKTYAKQLSGKLKEQKIAKSATLSSFQVKAIRTVAAVVALIIFSFFGVKNIINKEVADYQSDEVGLPVKGKPVVAATKPVEKKAVIEPTKMKEDRRLAESQPVKKKAKRTVSSKPPVTNKKKEVAKKPVSVAKKPTTKPKVAVSKPTAPADKKMVAANPEKKKEMKSSSVSKVAENKEATKSVPDKLEADSPLADQAKVKPIRSIPTIKKMDASKQVEASKPIGGSTPSVVPVPGGRQR